MKVTWDYYKPNIWTDSKNVPSHQSAIVYSCQVLQFCLNLVVFSKPTSFSDLSGPSCGIHILLLQRLWVPILHGIVRIVHLATLRRRRVAVPEVVLLPIALQDLELAVAVDGCEILRQLMVDPSIYKVLSILLVVKDFFHPQ